MADAIGSGGVGSGGVGSGGQSTWGSNGVETKDKGLLTWDKNTKKLKTASGQLVDRFQRIVKGVLKDFVWDNATGNYTSQGVMIGSGAGFETEVNNDPATNNGVDPGKAQADALEAERKRQEELRLKTEEDQRKAQEAAIAAAAERKRQEEAAQFAGATAVNRNEADWKSKLDLSRLKALTNTQDKLTTGEVQRQRGENPFQQLAQQSSAAPYGAGSGGVGSAGRVGTSGVANPYRPPLSPGNPFAR